MTFIQNSMSYRQCGINCGSGQRPFTSVPGVIEWVNLDKVDRPGMVRPDLVCDGANIEAALDSSIDYFVLHHVLEHFGCGEALGLIQEAHRVLKPGGSLLVFVPDLRLLADRWLTTRMDTQLFMTNVYGAYMNDEADRHRWGFDRDSLHKFLRDAVKWQEVRLFDWRRIDGADIARDWWIASLECIR